MPEQTTTPESATPTAAPRMPSLADFQAGLEQAFAAKGDQPAPAPEIAPAPVAPVTPATVDSEPAPAMEPVAKPTKDNPVAALPARGPKAAQWAEVNSDREKLRTRLTELETQLKEFQQKATVNDEVEPLKKKLSEYDSLLREVAAERHPELVGPIRQKEAAALELAKKAVRDPDLQQAVVSLLQQPASDARDEALNAILDDLKPTARTRLENAMVSMEQAQIERQSLAQRSSEAIAQRQKADQERRVAMLQEFDRELQDWTSDERGLDLLRAQSNDSTHNQRARDIAETARSLYSGNVQKPRDVARAALWASVAPYLVEQNQSLLGQVGQLTSEINKLKGVSPGLAGQGSSAPSGEEDDALPAGETLSERLVRGYMKQGGRIG